MFKIASLCPACNAPIFVEESILNKKDVACYPTCDCRQLLVERLKADIETIKADAKRSR